MLGDPMTFEESFRAMHQRRAELAFHGRYRAAWQADSAVVPRIQGDRVQRSHALSSDHDVMAFRCHGRHATDAGQDAPEVHHRIDTRLLLFRGTLHVAGPDHTLPPCRLLALILRAASKANSARLRVARRNSNSRTAFRCS